MVEPGMIAGFPGVQRPGSGPPEVASGLWLASVAAAHELTCTHGSAMELFHIFNTYTRMALCHNHLLATYFLIKHYIFLKM